MQKEIFDEVFASRRSSFTLRMAPMIDMIFLLLLFFLVAAKWRPQENFLPFQLPVAQAQEHGIGKPEPLTIQICSTQAGCEVQIGQLYAVQLEDQTIEANLIELMGKMKDCLIAQKRFISDPIEIVCDASVKWEHLTKIYNIFFGAGLTDITFTMTEQPNDGNSD